MNRSILVAVVAVVCVVGVLGFFMMSGGGSSPKGYSLDVGAETDDGGVAVLNALLPEMKAGFVNGGGEGVLIGVLLAGENPLTSRGLYRFDISNWEEGDITLHIRCVDVGGSPGEVEVYVVKDFGALPASPGENPVNVSDTWNLVSSGIKVGSTSPSKGKWIEVVVDSSVVEKMRSADGYLAFMLKLANENVEPGNVYIFSTYEYTASHDGEKPHLTWG